MGLYRHLPSSPGVVGSHVDLATHSVAPILLWHPASETQRITWAIEDDLWLRRW